MEEDSRPPREHATPVAVKGRMIGVASDHCQCNLGLAEEPFKQGKLRDSVRVGLDSWEELNGRERLLSCTLAVTRPT
jgi:hypothetical protein